MQPSGTLVWKELTGTQHHAGEQPRGQGPSNSGLSSAPIS